MLIAASTADERATTAHRAKLAYVYVRQSSLNQVKQHQESTELQYRLVDRAIALGWPHERVQVIDEDLGKSGTGSVERQGFQKLIAEIGLGNAGLAVSLDASRLARNNRDWHQLLELCSVFAVLIADGERLYDPRAYHDRLLLGLSGIMSEAKLHQIRMRLHQGERQKAERGELRLPLPAGLVYDRTGAIILSPDEEVQARAPRLRQVQGAAKRTWRDALSARERAAVACPTFARAVAARGDLARGRQRARARYPSQPGICWGLRLWPPAEGSEPQPTRIGAGNDQGSCRGLGGLPASRSSWLYRLGGVHDQSAATGRQCQPL